VSRPVLVVTNHVPPDRVGAFRALHERVGIELLLFGGRSHHATEGVVDPGVPFREIEEREAGRLASEGRAVICGTAGRRALPAAFLGARRARVPFVLWSALWHEPRTPAHIAARPLMRHIHRSAGAVVTYGPHVSEHARRLGAKRVFEAPQAVDNAFWGEPQPTLDHDFTVLFAGRPVREKGFEVLREAWRIADLGTAELVVAGGCAGPVSPTELRNFYASADVLVVPSVRTASFREPWGLVCNEAMNQALAIIASDETGAAAGGLVRHERNGLVTRAGDAAELAAALRRLHGDPALRARLGEAGRRDVAVHTHEAFAAGFAEALLACGAA
jgi:glycosyltransferase involved in cell wall biosynthesis